MSGEEELTVEDIASTFALEFFPDDIPHEVRVQRRALVERWFTAHDARIASEAAEGALRELAQALADRTPYGMELRQDGNEDREAAAYVQGIGEAHNEATNRAKRLASEREAGDE